MNLPNMLGFVVSCSGSLISDCRIWEGQAVSRKRHRAPTAARGRRVRAVECSAAPVLQSVTGKIRIREDVNEIAAGDTITIEYTPDDGSPFLDEDSSSTMLWIGGFNGWRGDNESGSESQTLHFPFTPLLNGSFRVSVCVPNYAKTIDFAVTDMSGYVFDNNSEKYYSIPVKYQKRLDKKGNVMEYVAGEGEEIKRDLSAEQETSPVMVPEEEQRLHRIRGEAALVGEEKGLGNILVSQARDTFERFDHGRMGFIDIADVGKALAEMSFDLEESEIDGLVKQFVKGEKKCSMVEWMLIYAELELSDYGLNLV